MEGDVIVEEVMAEIDVSKIVSIAVCHEIKTSGPHPAAFHPFGQKLIQYQ